MTTRESILKRLSEAVSGSEQAFYTQEQLNEFADYHLDKWDKNTSGDVIAEAFLDYWWNSENEVRRCSVCGKLMKDGYCIGGGEAYYCSERCLRREVSHEKYMKLYEADAAYWTEW